MTILNIIMKYLLILFSICCLVSCKTQNSKTPKQSNFAEIDSVYIFWKEYKSRTLSIKKDDIGGLYYQMKEAEGKTTFLFRYEQNETPDYTDGHYSEEILFELEESVFYESFKDTKPDKTLFGVFCYCKGKAGYYPTEGILISFDKKTKIITITIDQLIENQILSTIKLTKE